MKNTYNINELLNRQLSLEKTASTYYSYYYTKLKKLNLNKLAEFLKKEYIEEENHFIDFLDKLEDLNVDFELDKDIFSQKVYGDIDDETPFNIFHTAKILEDKNKINLEKLYDAVLDYGGKYLSLLPTITKYMEHQNESINEIEDMISKITNLGPYMYDTMI